MKTLLLLCVFLFLGDTDYSDPGLPTWPWFIVAGLFIVVCIVVAISKDDK